VHRDLKPGNVLVDATGRARVLDFGLAYDAAAGDGLKDANAGTPAYMAPEQVRREEVGPPADVHAIGVMLYEMLTGKRPWDGEDAYAVLLRNIVSVAPIPPTERNPSIPPNVEAICVRCLAKAPQERFPTARELAIALDAARLGKTVNPLPRTTARVTDAAPLSLPPASSQPDPTAAPVHRK